ncbi:ADP-ribosylglycohydrolase family protein [Phormidium yuhuli AB48]|uniref:ADP-ribosylglycohydrolase family protein n=2 Tax=Phormidium TaxID=1198 RepID=A0ABY5AWU5_9CYAN|nr:ADP-ribosylglycohydrolase family protein [Phormidium yuhuli]USR93231.1 ADP-ribosylglycohydrolase family protein [Phormidium yuhuli AB48]
MGVCVADALGVPVEFSSRAEREEDPVTDIRGYGTYNQPPGTWSDDSSLTFCLADALCDGFDLTHIAKKFCLWFTEALWTPYNEVFDVGGATSRAISELLRGVPPTDSGGTDERSNGNGSLMRILPLVYFAEKLPLPDLLERVHQVSAITHAHPRSQMACGIYISIASQLLRGKSPQIALKEGLAAVDPLYQQLPFTPERSHFQRLNSQLAQLPIQDISSTGYVVHSLEAALWCFLNSNSYAEAVLQAINLGSDTDTVAAITGGLAGLYYGYDGIPESWREAIARKEDIIALAQRLAKSLP